MDTWKHALPYLKASLKLRDLGLQLPLEDQPVIRVLGNDLLITYVVNVGDTFKYIQVGDLKHSGITEIDLHDHSMPNLRSLVNTKRVLKPYGHVFAVLMDGHFESSLLLIDELWDETFLHLAPRGFVATVAARDIMAFCDIGSSAGISELRAVVNRAQAGDHLITPILFRRSERLGLNMLIDRVFSTELIVTFQK